MLRGQTGKISVLSVDISVLEQRDHCWMEVLPLVVQSFGTLADVPELHSFDFCDWKLCKEVMTTL